MNRTKRSKCLSLFLSLLRAMTRAIGLSFPSLAADQEIVVLYTNDVHCSVDENIGYDFAIPGNHEFDYGMPRFLELSTSLDCGYSSCNFMDLRTGGTVFDPYRIFTYGDTKVAFVGVTTPESFTKSTPAYFQDGNGNYIYGFCEDESGQKLYAQVQSAVDSARAEGADMVILVAHLGENGVTGRWSSDSVLSHTTGIDACIDGHSHESYMKYAKNKDGRDRACDSRKERGQ